MNRIDKANTRKAAQLGTGSWLRCRSGSIAAPVVAHATLNATAYLAARIVVHAAS